jgi:hypothetical protein
MSLVTLSPQYVRKVAESYKLLRAPDEYCAPHVLDALVKSTDRCIQAHLRCELQLTEDVRLPLPMVLRMLMFVHDNAAERLAVRAPAPAGLLARLRSSLLPA